MLLCINSQLIILLIHANVDSNKLAAAFILSTLVCFIFEDSHEYPMIIDAEQVTATSAAKRGVAAKSVMKAAIAMNKHAV